MSCKGARSTSELVAEVEAELSEELGAEVKVHCPTMVDQSYHYCTAEVTGHEDLAFPVRIKPGGDELHYTTKRWVTGARMVALGKHHLDEKLGITVDSLSCPMISHLPDGAKVRCEAQAEGVHIPIEVGMVIKVRKLSFEPIGGVVVGKRAAERAQKELREKGIDAEVKCPRRLVVSVSGKRFECEATLPDKTMRVVHFLITGTNGELLLGLEPPKLESPKREGAPKEAAADAAP